MRRCAHALILLSVIAACPVQMYCMHAKAVVSLTADPMRPGFVIVELLRAAEAPLAPRPKIARRVVASDCAGAAGPYSVRAGCPRKCLDVGCFGSKFCLLLCV